MSIIPLGKKALNVAIDRALRERFQVYCKKVKRNQTSQLELFLEEALARAEAELERMEKLRAAEPRAEYNPGKKETP